MLVPRGQAVVVGDHPHEPRTVVEREAALDGLAIPGGGGNVAGAHYVGTAVVGVECDGAAGGYLHRPADAVSFADADGLELREALLALDPPLAGHDDPGVLVHDVGVGVKLEFDPGSHDAAPPWIAVGGSDLEELPSHLAPQRLGAPQDGADPLSLGALPRELLTDDVDLQLREAVELQLQDRVGLNVTETKAGDDPLGGVLLTLAVADEDDALVQRIEDGLEAFEDMNSLQKLREVELEPAPHDIETEVQELPEQCAQPHLGRRADLWVLGREQHRRVYVDVDLQVRVPEQVGHGHHCGRAPLQLQHDADVVGALVPHVDQLRHMAVANQLADLLDEGGLVPAPGHRVDDDVAPPLRLLLDPGGPKPHGAAARRVDRRKLRPAIEDLAPHGEVGALDVLHQPGRRQLRVIDERHGRANDLPEVVRRDVGRHADRDAHAAVHQQLGNTRREHHGLGGRSVVVRSEGDCVPIDLGDHLEGQGLKARLGVAHGGWGVAVEGAEVAGSVDERRAQRERLSEPHHRVVDALVAVGVIAGHDGAHDGGALPKPGGGAQVQVRVHCVENASLDRLQAVADIGQGPGSDDGQRVVQIPFTSRPSEGDSSWWIGRCSAAGWG